MTKPSGFITAHRQFPILFAAQTIGAIILFWNAVPLYREILADPAAHELQPENLALALSSIVLMQAGYWISHRINPPIHSIAKAFIGSVILFLAHELRVRHIRFRVCVYHAKARLPYSGLPVIVTLGGLFSLYCYVQELERLGRTFAGREKRPEPTH